MECLYFVNKLLEQFFLGYSDNSIFVNLLSVYMELVILNLLEKINAIHIAPQMTNNINSNHYCKSQKSFFPFCLSSILLNYDMLDLPMSVFMFVNWN